MTRWPQEPLSTLWLWVSLQASLAPGGSEAEAGPAPGGGAAGADLGSPGRVKEVTWGKYKDVPVHRGEDTWGICYTFPVTLIMDHHGLKSPLPLPVSL